MNNIFRSTNLIEQRGGMMKDFHWKWASGRLTYVRQIEKNTKSRTQPPKRLSDYCRSPDVRKRMRKLG